MAWSKWRSNAGEMVGRYLVRLLISVDQLANVIVGGVPDETLSSRCGKRVDTCRLCYWLCRGLDRIDPGHCKDAIEPDEGYDYW